ncbi:MAG TPA: hypothetical protein VNG90_00335 [Candidatus Acidoferrum sp.]|nr:hypothetical protein [Candidatus Acidoferrum sp.]
MGHLATGLQKFYYKDKGRVVFVGNITLNQLALHMWAELGFQKVDASVLSRIISGERLPTPAQLETFCQVLKLGPRDREYLFFCLSQDYFERGGVKHGGVFMASSDAATLMGQLADQATTLLYQGRCSQLLVQSKAFGDLYAKVMFNQPDSEPQRRFLAAYGEALYVKGRAIGSQSSSGNVLSALAPLSGELLKLATQSGQRRLRGLAYILLADSHYIAGRLFQPSAPGDIHKVTQLRKAIRYGTQALPYLADTDHEKLFAIRTIVASANYLADETVITHFKRLTTKLIPRQPQQNYVNALHLAGTFAHGQAILGHAEPFAIKDLATQHFKTNLVGTGIYELSDIKSTIEALRQLKTTDRGLLKQQLTRGLVLAEQDNFIRHQRYLKKISAES